MPSQTNPTKVPKRSMPKESASSTLDEDSLQIPVPHATKSLKNLGAIPHSGNKKERIRPLGYLLNMN